MNCQNAPREKFTGFFRSQESECFFVFFTNVDLYTSTFFVGCLQSKWLFLVITNHEKTSYFLPLPQKLYKKYSLLLALAHSESHTRRPLSISGHQITQKPCQSPESGVGHVIRRPRPPSVGSPRRKPADKDGTRIGKFMTLQPFSFQVLKLKHVFCPFA